MGLQSSVRILIPTILIFGMFIFLAGCSEEEAKPVVRITQPSDGLQTENAVVLLNGEVENNTSDQVSISVNGFTRHTASITNGQFSAMVTLDDGENVIEALIDGVKAQVRVTRTVTISVADTGEMVLIPAGEFMMGDHHGDGWSEERPVHPVYLDAFYVDKYEVTNAQYKKFVRATGHKEPESHIGGFRPWSDPTFNGDNQPVVCVSWDDAKAYADWAGKRLPTEAEWEKAVRGGLPGRKYVWGDDWPPPKGAGNFADETFKKTFPSWVIPCIIGYDDGYAGTAPVGSFSPNGYGLHDMAGNVTEWCQDWYGGGYYSTSPRENPTGPISGSSRVLRGGSWFHHPYWDYLRVAYRGFGSPDGAGDGNGFRCAGL